MVSWSVSENMSRQGASMDAKNSSPIQPPSDSDIVVPFSTDRAGAVGRIVKLDASVDEILRRHDYPNAVSHTLGEALALCAMLGTTLKIGGRLILQTSTDGPLKMLVVNFDAPGHLRGYASFDDRVSNFESPEFDKGALLGNGHLALTVDPGGDLDRYQGIVALNRTSLTDAALHYFRQSEQLPSFLKLAVAHEYRQDDSSAKATDAPSDNDKWSWRASGILVQHVAREGGNETKSEASDTRDGGDEHAYEQDAGNEDWKRTLILAQTVEDYELLDTALPPDRLLYRLFHEEGVRATDPVSILAKCRCSRERVEGFVKNFSAEELRGLREPDGGVTVTCEFCNDAYRFEPDELAGS